MAKLGINTGTTMKVADGKLDVSDTVKNGAAAGATALQSVTAPLTKTGTTVGIGTAGNKTLGVTQGWGYNSDDVFTGIRCFSAGSGYLGVAIEKSNGLKTLPSGEDETTGIGIDFTVVAKKTDIPSITDELELAEPLYWIS